MNTADFDRWRLNYDTMTYDDQLAFYNRVAVDHPVQHGFDGEAFRAFFEAVEMPEIQVLEFGGWKGELAAEVLPLYPHITHWTNLEISILAASDVRCRDGRYRAIVPSAFAWELDQLPDHNVFVSSHAIEHIRAAELEQLLAKLPRKVTYIGLQAPLADGPGDWSGYYGSHILEVGWKQVGAMLQVSGFAEFVNQGEFRGYKR